MKRARLHFILLLICVSTLSKHSSTLADEPTEPIAPSPQALCNAMLKIIGWNDLTESANTTNADRVSGSGLVRLLGSQLATPVRDQDPRYEIFFPPAPGKPHAIAAPPKPTNVAATSMGEAPKENVDRLTGLLFDGRNNWETTRYFFTPYNPLQVTELASMWQRHARNAEDLQESGNAVFGGDGALTQVQDAVERGLHGDKPFWAHIGFEAQVDGIGQDGSLEFPNAGPGYAPSVPFGERVLVDYILMYDPTDGSRPSGMVVVLRFPQ